MNNESYDMMFLGKPTNYWIALDAKLESEDPDFHELLVDALLRARKAERELSALKKQLSTLLSKVKDI